MLGNVLDRESPKGSQLHNPMFFSDDAFVVGHIFRGDSIFNFLLLTIRLVNGLGDRKMSSFYRRVFFFNLWKFAMCSFAISFVNQEPFTSNCVLTSHRRIYLIFCNSSIFKVIKRMSNLSCLFG